MTQGIPNKFRQNSFMVSLSLIQVNVMARLNYLSDFWLMLFLMAADQSIGVLTLAIIFTKVTAMAGWSLNEMVFLYGLSLLSNFLYRFCLQGVSDIPWLIENGDFDQVLIRPRPSLLLVLTRRSNTMGFVDLILGLFISGSAAVRMDIQWNIATIAAFIMFILCANILIVAIILMQATISFWLIRLRGLGFVIFNLRQFGRYPIKIYPLLLRGVLIGIIPIAFTTYYPACNLLKKGGNNYWILPAVPLITAVVSLAAIGFYNLGVRHYKSTGS